MGSRLTWPRSKNLEHPPAGPVGFLLRRARVGRWNWSGQWLRSGIFSRSGGPVLAGAVELVSPANKDRPAHRDALVSEAPLSPGGRRGGSGRCGDRAAAADLHRELLARVGAGDVPGGPPLFAAAYRPVERAGATALDVWLEPPTVGQPLATLPLWLRGGLCLPVELEATYERTCVEQRVRTAA